MSLLQWCNWCLVHFCYKNQIFHYTRCNTPKSVTSLRGPSPNHCDQATQLLSKKCCSGGKPLATLCPIWSTQNLNPRPPAPETNALPLDQLYNFNHYKCFELGVSNVAYQYTGIISIQYRYVSFETPCMYFLTNLAQKYHEQIGWCKW